MKLQFTGGNFAEARARAARSVPDLTGFTPASIEPHLLARARAAWRHRVIMEYRSIQHASRFLTEVVEAGDALDVHWSALELVGDEIFQAEACAAVCDALGVEPELPEPSALVKATEFTDAPAIERSLATAISVLAISESISTALIRDLAERCGRPPLKAVLEAIIRNAHRREEFGWSYVSAALERVPAHTLPDFRHLARRTLARYEEGAHRVLMDVPESEQELDAHPEPELASLGLLSPTREALLYFRTRDRDVVPKLEALDLISIRRASGTTAIHVPNPG